MDIQQMKELKTKWGYSNIFLADLTGIPLGTLQKIFSGETKQPRHETLKKLEYLFAQELRTRGGAGREPEDIRAVREEAAYYGAASGQKRQGEYTLTDYYALPDDQRAELIDGVLYDMGAPSTNHQLIAGEVHRQISNYIQGKGGKCVPFISPVDVQLDRDEKTMVEPDVAIVCNRNQVIRRCIYGAPDFVLEVISPGTKLKDYTTKLMKYMQAGVREYWLADPDQNTILVYFFEDAVCCPVIYPLDGEIPVYIYGGDLKICLSGIMEWMVDEETEAIRIRKRESDAELE